MKDGLTGSFLDVAFAWTADYILKFVAENTEDFARIHPQHLTRLPGIAQMQSSFALRNVFKTTALPMT